MLANGMDILYYQVNDITVAQASNPVIPTERFLHTFPATVRGSCVSIHLSSIHLCECVNSCSTKLGITYHFYWPNGSNVSEIYVSLDSNEIRKLTVAVDKSIDDVKLTVIGNDTFVYSASDGYQLGGFNMDWVYNILYWVEMKGGMSRICRLPLDRGIPEKVGLPQNGVILDIFPDPLYG